MHSSLAIILPFDTKLLLLMTASDGLTHELGQRVLAMAKTGVYRESIFEALQPMATKRQIREAIALAKAFGLQSNPKLRDPELGTYYQVSLQQYESFQSAVQASLAPGVWQDPTTQLVEMTLVLRRMVRLVGGIALVLLAIGSGYILSNQLTTGALFCSAALCAGGIWMLQKQLVKPFS
jgi:hypothetical protein